ncbi:MAG: helix-turn-helix domain-containing protein [Bacillota bacterium]
MNQGIGARIRVIRTQKGFSQEYVAKKIGYKHSSTLSEIESGKKGLNSNKIPIVAEVLGVDINDLFFDQYVHKVRTS